MTKTSEAPQRVVLHFNDPSADGGLEGWWHVCDGANGTGLGWYVPENHAQAMVAAAYEAAANTARLWARAPYCLEQPDPGFPDLESNLRALISDDVRAALDEMLAEERKKALREAAALRDKLVDAIGCAPCSSIHSALCEYRNSILALINKEADG